MDADLRRRVEASGYDVPGFAERYEAVRPRPPASLLELVPPLLTGPLRIVVDLGSGTGLSTRFWAGVAGEVIGVEPSDGMRRVATRVTREPNVRFVAGSGARTGLDAGTVDLVAAAQSLHWMDPAPTLAEIGRLLRPGGVLCAFEYSRLQTPLWEPEAAWGRVREAVGRLRQARGLDRGLELWPVSTERIAASGLFGYVTETMTNSLEHGDGARLLQLALSEGSLQTVLAAGATEEEVGLPELRRATASMPDVPWWFGYRVWLARKS